MSWVQQTVAEFGRGIGIDGLGFNAQGVVRLSIESLGALFIEEVEDDVLIYLVRDIGDPVGKKYSRALSLCHWEHQRSPPVQPGLRHERQLAFSIRMSANQFTLPALETAVAQLERMHDEVQQCTS